MSEPVDGFLGALALRDIDTALATVADDVRVTVHALDIQDGDRADLRTVLDDLVTAFPDLRVTIKRVIVTGAVVTTELKLEGTQAAGYAGAINQEKHLDIDQAWRFEVRDGRIAAVTAYLCAQQLLRRLGVKRFDQIAIA
jgi:steroid delta-isomerase-like uncharacterized protein